MDLNATILKSEYHWDCGHLTDGGSAPKPASIHGALLKTDAGFDTITDAEMMMPRHKR